MSANRCVLLFLFFFFFFLFFPLFSFPFYLVGCCCCCCCLEHLFPPMNGTCDAVHHVEHSKTWKRTGNVQEEYKGIPADPTMSVTVRQQATTVSARRRVVLNLGDGMLLTFVFVFGMLFLTFRCRKCLPCWMLTRTPVPSETFC